MDAEIYKLLARAEQEKNVEFLRQAFNILDPDTPSLKEKSTKDVENFGQNLYIECAEKAINFDENNIAVRCLQIYFGLPRISNQFLAALISANSSFWLQSLQINWLENLEKSLPFLFKTIEFALHNKRYNFLIYNASIIFWKYARAFMKKNFRFYLCASLKALTDALNEIDDADYEWRAFLERTLVEAYVDNKQTEEASQLARELLKFIQNYLPNTFDDYFEFLTNNNLLTDEELKAMSANKWELSVIYRIDKLKKNHKTPKKSHQKKQDNDENSMSEEAILNELTEIYNLLIPKNKYHAKLETDEDSSQFLKASSDKSQHVKEDFATKQKRQRLLLNLAHVSLMFEEVNVCSQILGYLKETDLINEEFSLELDLIDCQLIIKSLLHKQERYQRSIVRLRVDTINRCDEVLHNAKRLLNPRLIQLGCMMQWNAILPLLQPGIRNQIRKPLQVVAEYLEEIDSMEWLLRCQVHFEIAKCDEEIEQLQTAEQHLLKALQLDDEKIYQEQLNYALKRLRLRAELYKTPEVVEEQAAMILEQCVIGGGKSSQEKFKPALADLLAMLNSKPGQQQTAVGQINIHSLLLRTANLLSPSDFAHVLESETFKSFAKASENQISRLHKKILNYENCIRKCTEHVNERIADLDRQHRRANPTIQGDELEALIRYDFKDRFKLWFDLSKIARKQQIWDICRVSCRFCLVFDNEKHIARFLRTESGRNRSMPSSAVTETKSQHGKSAAIQLGSLFDKDIMRNIAESHFIFGEALVHYIRQEGVELFERPSLPDITDNKLQVVKFNDRQAAANPEFKSQLSPENETEWKEYCDWLNRLSKEAIDHFLRGVQIGVQLNESWLVTQGGAYIWNYLHHMFEKKKFGQVVHILTELLDSLKNEPDLLVAVCVALANGLIAQWLPQEQVRQLQIPKLESESTLLANGKPEDKKKATTQSSQAAVANAPKSFTMTSEASSDFKKALEVCDYALSITNGENLADVVSLKSRFPLIKTWIMVKQFNQSPIKNLGLSKTNSRIERSQDKFTKCMIGTEILNKNLKMASLGLSSYEVRDPPTVKELVILIEQASSWPDKLIELELWTGLAYVCGRTGQTENLKYCHSKSLECLSYFEKKKSENMGLYKTSQLLLCEACISLGEHLANLLSSGNPILTSKQNRDNQLSSSSHHTASLASFKDIRLALRREALNSFADAASYAARAESYDLAIHSARHYWNLCLPYLSQIQERAYLYENLREILQSLHTAYKFRPRDADKAELEELEAKAAAEKAEAEKKEAETKAKGNKKVTVAADVKDPKKTKQESSVMIDKNKSEATAASAAKETKDSVSKPFDPLEDAFDDLTLRCVLYACLFQILIDKQQYEEALEAMENSLNELPRTKHRLLVYRFKVITKSKLGLDVQMDLQKFREESERNLAQMYRKVAISSLKHSDTISLYQRAIETLNSEENIWLRFEYIIELAQWMYSNEYSLANCVSLSEWAAHLIMFGVKLDKPLTGAMALAAVSRSLSIVSQVGAKNNRASAVNSIAGGKKGTTATGSASVRAPPLSMQVPAHSIMPTIADNAEIKPVHDEISKTAAVEFDKVNDEKNTEDKLSMFDIVPENPNLTLDELTNIKQLECLTRAYVCLAKISSRESTDYIDYVMSAHSSVLRLFSQAYENGVSMLKEIQKYDANLAAQADAIQESKGKKDAKSAAQPADKKAVDKKPSKIDYSLPRTLEEWSQFEPIVDVVQAWSHELMRKLGINAHTISEPYLLFLYLDTLETMLRQHGCSHFLFPVLYLQLLLANHVIKLPNGSPHVSLNIYVRLKLINLCVELNLTSSVPFHQQQLALLVLSTSRPVGGDSNAAEQAAASVLGSVTSSPVILTQLVRIDANEVVAVREQIYAHKKRMAQVLEEEASQSMKSSASIGASSQNESLASLKLKRKQQQMLFNKIQNVKIHESSKAGSNGEKKSDPIEAVVDEFKLPGDKPKVHESLHDLLYRDAWLKVAEQLIEIGLFHSARDYLYECLNACVSFESRHSLAKVYYYLGRIALYDSNFIEAKNYASSAQRVAIDETFWYKSIVLMVEAHKLDYHKDKDAYDKCVKILRKAIELVVTETPQRTNKKWELAYVEAMLNYSLAELICEGLLTERLTADQFAVKQKPSGKRPAHKNSMHHVIFKRLSEVCNMYTKSASQLIKNGYIRESVQVIRSHARLLKQFAVDCNNPESKKDYLLQAHHVYAEAEIIVNGCWEDISSLQEDSDSSNVSLTIERELVDFKLEFAQFQSDMLEIYLDEIKMANEKDLSKDMILRTVENFIEDEDDWSPIERKWRGLLKGLPDATLAGLTICQTHVKKLKHLRARTFYLLGRVFRIIGELKNQLRKTDLGDEAKSSDITLVTFITKWGAALFEIYRRLQTENNDLNKKAKSNTTVRSVDLTSQVTINGTNGQPLDSSFAARQQADQLEAIFSQKEFSAEEDNTANMAKQEEVRKLLEAVVQMEAQGMDCLLQALAMGFAIEDNVIILELYLSSIHKTIKQRDFLKELMKNVTLELIELVGQLDLNICSQLISFYQSCSSAVEMERIIQRASLDPKSSLLSGYFHQLNFYSSLNVSRNMLNSPIVNQTLELTRDKLKAFKYLTLNQNHFTCVKDLPPNYTVLVLQHNHKRNGLYCTLIDCSKNLASVNKAPPKPSQSNSKTTVTKIRTSPGELAQLQQQWREWKNDLKQFHLKLEYQITSSMSKKEVVQQAATNSVSTTSNVTTVVDLKPPQSATTHVSSGVEHPEDLIRFYVTSNSAKYDETMNTLNDMNARFENLIGKTENYMREITDFIQNYFDLIQTEQQQAQQQTNVKSAATAPQPNFKPNERLIILADLELFEFPLESLRVFYNSPCFCSITRDFSLNQFVTRFLSQKESTELTQGGKDEKKDKTAAAKGNDKKGGATTTTIPMEPLPENAVVIDQTRLKYLVDVYNESSVALPPEFNLSSSFKKLHQQYNQIGAKWSGVNGDHPYAISTGECERLLSEANCFLFNGFERFLSYFNSTRIASFNMNDCKLILANDLAQTSKSFSRIGKNDVLRNPIEVECENPIESAVLLSLTGVKTIMLNQWSSTLVENCEKFRNLLRDFIENKQSSGEIIKYRTAPHNKFLLEEKIRKEEEKRAQAEKEKETKKDTKKDKKDTKSAAAELPKSPNKKQRDKGNESKLDVRSGVEESLALDPAVEIEEKARLEALEEEKRMQHLRDLSKLRKENLNLICFGLPDVYMTS